MILKNKVAIVTGASSGIGAAIAELFAENGAKVVVSDIDKEGGEKLVKKIKKSKGKAVFVKADISKPKDCQKLVKETLKAYKKLDIAVNNAGVGGVQKNISDYPTDEWDKVSGINLSGVFYGMHYQIPEMLKNKGGGVVINMASVLGQVGTPMSSAYVAAKHGVVGLTKNAALEFAKEGIRAVAVGPGYIETPLLSDNLDEEQMQGIAAMHPVGRLGKPKEVAELVLWLSSDKASFVTGSYYNVDGGYLAK